MKFNYLLLLCVALPHTAYSMLNTTSHSIKPRMFMRAFSALTSKQRKIHHEYLEKLKDKQKAEEANIEDLNKEITNYTKNVWIDSTYATAKVATSLRLNQSTQNLLNIEKQIFDVESKLAESFN